MYLYLRIKFQVSIIILTNFKGIFKKNLKGPPRLGLNNYLTAE